MILAEGDSDPFLITITVSAGAVLITTLVALWIRELNKRRNEEKRNGKGGPDEPIS